jgi:hypothetical protein
LPAGLWSSEGTVEGGPEAAHERGMVHRDLKSANVKWLVTLPVASLYSHQPVSCNWQDKEEAL